MPTDGVRISSTNKGTFTAETNQIKSYFYSVFFSPFHGKLLLDNWECSCDCNI